MEGNMLQRPVLDPDIFEKWEFLHRKRGSGYQTMFPFKCIDCPKKGGLQPWRLQPDQRADNN